MPDELYHNQPIETDDHLLAVSLQRDYFSVKPSAPKIINIDVLSSLLSTAIGVLSIVFSNHQEHGEFTIKRSHIISSINSAEDCINSAYQVIAHANKDHPLINDLSKAEALLMMIEEDNREQCNGDLTISRALEVAIDLLIATKKECQKLPDTLTNYIDRDQAA